MASSLDLDSYLQTPVEATTEHFWVTDLKDIYVLPSLQSSLHEPMHEQSTFVTGTIIATCISDEFSRNSERQLVPSSKRIKESSLVKHEVTCISDFEFRRQRKTTYMYTGRFIDSTDSYLHIPYSQTEYDKASDSVYTRTCCRH